MKTYRGNFVYANDIRIHYYRTTPPGGKQALLLLHGLTDNGLCWARVAEALEDTYDIVMPDARGHGLSDRPAGGYSLKDRAADVAGLIDALGLNQPLLVGHSLGGETALASAALYPNKVRALILEDPALFPDTDNPASWKATAQRWLDQLVEQQSLSRAALIAGCLQQNPAWSAGEAEAWAVAKRQMDPDALVSILTSMGGKWQDLLRAVACPVLLVTGHPEKAIINPGMVAEAAGLWQQGQEANIPNAGHSIHRDQFKAFLAKVKPFLDQHARA